MTPEELNELRTLIQSELEDRQAPTMNMQDVVRTAVHETMITLGIDASSPLDVQKDLAFLRDMRQATDTIRTRGILVLVGILVAGIAAAAWVGMKAGINS